MKNILLILLLFPYSGFSQNLVLNGSFEDTLSCPNSLGQIDRAQFWYTTGGSTDYFNSNCIVSPFGYQLPFEGNAYAGIITGSPTGNTREYVEGTLATPLLAGHCYQLSYYINAGHFNYTTDAHHAYFSDSLITGMIMIGSMFSFTPQIINTPGNFPDTMNWMLIQQNFVANGGEQYIILGNFWDNTQGTYLQINNSSGTPGSYMYIDSVSLIEVICTGLDESKESSIDVWPNPVSTILNITSEINENLEFIIYNSLMEICYETKFLKSHQLSVEDLSSGFYYYQLNQDKKIIKRGKIILSR